ncbi:hypothetical protein QYM36_000022, partial [Artemia franciscana]
MEIEKTSVCKTIYKDDALPLSVTESLHATTNLREEFSLIVLHRIQDAIAKCGIGETLPRDFMQHCIEERIRYRQYLQYGTSIKNKLQMEEKKGAPPRDRKYQTKKAVDLTEDISRESHTFDQIIGQRAAQARKTVVIQVGSRKSAGDVHRLLSTFGDISEFYHYKTPNDNFILAEMADRGTASEILKSAVYTQEVSVVPVRSRFLWLKSNGSLNHEEVPNRPIPIQSFEPPDSQSLTEALLSCNDVSSQMELFYGKTKLTELEIRLRFLVCDQVESAFK